METKISDSHSFVYSTSEIVKRVKKPNLALIRLQSCRKVLQCRLEDGYVFDNANPIGMRSEFVALYKEVREVLTKYYINGNDLWEIIEVGNYKRVHVWLENSLEFI